MSVTASSQTEHAARWFPLILSTFAERTWHYFTLAKLLNVAFGTLVLILLFLIARYHLDALTAILATGLLAINGSFIWHSSAVISEPLLMVFILLAWHFTALGFRRGKFWALAGLFAGLAFLTKGSAPALVASFIVSVSIVKGKRSVKNVSWLLYLLAFFVVAAPYLAYNAQVFGGPFYNFNYTHAVWMSSSYDAHQTGALPTMGQLPVFPHVVGQIGAREWRGLVMMKNLLAYGLLPQGLTKFFQSIYATAGLVAAVALLGLFRKRVRRFVQAHTEFVASGATLAAAFLLPFAWYVTFSPDIRHFLPVIPILLVYIAASVLGIGRWILERTAGFESLAEKRAPVLCGVVLCGALVATSAAPLSDILANPFRVDREKNAYTEHVLHWLSHGVKDKALVLYGTSHMLPRWKHTDKLEFVTIPSDIVDWETLGAWCEGRGVDYAIIDTEMMSSRLTLLEKYFGMEQGRLTMKGTPPGWVLCYAYPDMPAGFLLFEYMRQPAVGHAVEYAFGDRFALRGYRLDPDDLHPGKDVHLTLYWEALQDSSGDYTVFTHLLDASGQMCGQVDSEPYGGVFPTSSWPKGMLLADRYDIPVAPDVLPGSIRSLSACMTWRL